MRSPSINNGKGHQTGEEITMYVDVSAIEQLKEFRYVPPKLHPDGRGHVQVEEVVRDQPERLDSILKAIDSENSWEECFSVFESQSFRWLIDISNLLRRYTPYHTACQLKIHEIITSIDKNSILISQSADEWFWDDSNLTHLAPLIEEVTRQLNDIEPDESARDAFIEKYARERRVGDDVCEKFQDISLLSQIKKRLEAKSKELALLYGT
ncbi:hypothetical protein [uncultured Vibrio sp.]|uniref:hypothetical protein n=1 Tax=uncultured Vibrio sp. TaxID=114054 RepID=UPI0025F8DCBE|nr:hypothetical protein [uncultured Vibrio sp.]